MTLLLRDIRGDQPKVGSSVDPDVGSFAPALDQLTGWWRADYAGAPWVPSASKGGSGSIGNLTAHTGTVSVGTKQNGKAPAHFAGAQDMLHASDITAFVSKQQGTVLALLKPNAAVAPTGNVYDDPAVFHDNNADLCITYSTSGFGVAGYDGAYKTKQVACATGAYHLVMMRWDSTNLGLTLDSASEQVVACGPLTIMTGALVLGQGSAGGFLSADILEIAFANYKFSNATYAAWKTNLNARYGLAL